MKIKRVLVCALLVSLLFFLVFLIAPVKALVQNMTAVENSNYSDGDVDDANTVLTTGPTIRSGDTGSNFYRAYIDFNTSLIPDSAAINSVSIQLTTARLAAIDIDVFSLNQSGKLLSSSGAYLKSLCGGSAGANLSLFGSSVYNNQIVGTVANISLNSNASFSLKANLAQDFFTICIKRSAGEGGLDNVRLLFNASESASPPILFVDYNLTDSTPPSTIAITSPIANKTYNGNEFPIRFNVSMNENGSANYTLNWLVNYSMQGNESAKFGTAFNHSNSSLADGNYTMYVWALDSAGNVNRTVNLSFVVDATKPVVTINSPTATTYTVNNYLINLTLNEGGTCLYSLDSGVTNNSLTNLGWMNTTFNATLTGVSNGAYTLNAYCNDTAGNTNLTTSVSYTVSVSTGSGGGDPPGGGGGGPATCTSFTYSSWSECINGQQTRTVLTSSPFGCSGGSPLTTQSCSITNNTCTDDCSTGSKQCSGNGYQECGNYDNDNCLEWGSVNACSTNEQCTDGACQTIVTITPIARINEFFNEVGSFAGNFNSTKPIIPIPGVPPIVVNVGTGVVGVGVIAGFAWWIFLAILSSFLPFFLIKLRHYSVSVFDSGNQLGMIDKKGEVNNTRLYSMLLVLEKNFGTLVFAGKEHNVMKYLIKSGFVEVRLDEPFIMTGHFVKSKDMALFKNALKETINKFGGRKVTILENVERASIIRVWRAYMRARKSQKELAKVVRR